MKFERFDGCRDTKFSLVYDDGTRQTIVLSQEEQFDDEDQPISENAITAFDPELRSLIAEKLAKKVADFVKNEATPDTHILGLLDIFADSVMGEYQEDPYGNGIWSPWGHNESMNTLEL